MDWWTFLPPLPSPSVRPPVIMDHWGSPIERHPVSLWSRPFLLLRLNLSALATGMHVQRGWTGGALD